MTTQSFVHRHQSFLHRQLPVDCRPTPLIRWEINPSDGAPMARVEHTTSDGKRIVVRWVAQSFIGMIVNNEADYQRAITINSEGGLSKVWELAMCVLEYRCFHNDPIWHFYNTARDCIK